MRIYIFKHYTYILFQRAPPHPEKVTFSHFNYYLNIYIYLILKRKGESFQLKKNKTHYILKALNYGLKKQQHYNVLSFKVKKKRKKKKTKQSFTLILFQTL